MSDCQIAITLFLILVTAKLLKLLMTLIRSLRRHQRAVKHTLRVSADLYEKLAPTQKMSLAGVRFRQFSAFPLCWVGHLPMFRTKYFRKCRALYMDALGVENEV